MKLRAAFALALAFLAVSSCAAEIPDEPAVSASVNEEIITDSETLPAPELSGEITEEATEEMTYEVTEDVTEEITEEITEENTETSTPETESPEPITVDQLLEFVTARAANYYSFRINTSTSVTINVLGSETFSETDSELSVKNGNAHFRRGGKDGFEHLYLVGQELYTENGLGKCRIDGYGLEEFLLLVNDMPITAAFFEGELKEDGEDFIMTFTQLGEDGKNIIFEMLGLPQEYAVGFDKTNLSMRIDRHLNMISSEIEIELSVNTDGQEVMTVAIRTESVHSDIDKDFALELPRPEDYVFFADDEVLEKYIALLREIGMFTASYTKFEYAVSDDMKISSGAIDLLLTSKAAYAYNSKVGVSIDKSFDSGDGTGPHTILTHFNYRRGFSQIDGGSIFLDTTINTNNLAFTFYYPFTTSFLGFEHCLGMNTRLSDASLVVLDLKESASKNIADNLLLRAGVLSSSVKLEDVTAYTYIKLGDDGGFDSVGYKFSATAMVGDETYELSRAVELKIISKSSANVKVIYIEVDDDE